MKKTIAAITAVLLLLTCAAGLAESAGSGAQTIRSADGNFSLSYELPEGTELLSGSWTDPHIYVANIRGTDGMYYYLSVVGEPDDQDPETVPVTYNEENGYTDDFLKSQGEEICTRNGFSNYSVSILSTDYGTKLIVIRVNDADVPQVYVMTCWNDYEIGLTAMLKQEDGTYGLISNAQMDTIIHFLSELWMADQAPVADETPDAAEAPEAGDAPDPGDAPDAGEASDA